MKVFLIGKLILLIFTLLSFSQNLYPIVEPDLLAEIEQKMPEVQKKLEKEVEKTAKKLQEPEFWSVSLPLAQKSTTYFVDMLYTLDFDVPRVDDKGRVVGVLYPKGYQFNPLHYVPAEPPTLIIFDGTDQRQVKYVKEKLLKQYPYRFLLASRGQYFKLLEVFGERVFFLHPRIRDKFRIKSGVSVVRWDRKGGKAIVEVHGCDKVGCRTATDKP